MSDAVRLHGRYQTRIVHLHSGDSVRYNQAPPHTMDLFVIGQQQELAPGARYATPSNRTKPTKDPATPAV